MYEQVDPKQELQTYRAWIFEKLLRDLAFAIHQTLDRPDMANIHDLRRLVLRLRHALRVFARLLPERPAGKMQRRLKKLQDLLGAVRACDVALAILQTPPGSSGAGKSEVRAAAALLTAERKRSLRPLRLRLRKMLQSDAIGRWRNRLLAA